MALPLKSGADLYNHELLRARLQNLGAQPNTADVGLGQVYFNTGSDTAASKRIGYCYETGSVPQFHHLANLEDISRLEELINELGEVSGGNISEVLTKVNTLDEKVTAFLDGTADSDAVLENLKEIQEFLDNYDAEVSLSEQLNDLSDAIDDVANRATKVSVSQTLASGKEIGSITVDGTATTLYAPATYAWGEITSKPTTLAGYGITDAVRASDAIDTSTMVNAAGYGYNAGGWMGEAGPALSFGLNHDYKVLIEYSFSSASGLYFKAIYQGEGGDWRRILDTGNYASVLDNAYLKLDGSSVMAQDALLKFQVGDGLYDWNVRRGQGFGILDYNTTAEEPQFRLGFHIGGSHYRLEISHQWGANILAYRTYDQNATEVGPWISILDANNFNSYAPTLTGAGASGTWNIDTRGIVSANGRPTTANTIYGDGSLRYYLASSSMTEGKPMEDSSIIHLSWDNTGGYDAQLAIGRRNETSLPWMQIRRAYGGQWSDWRTVAFTDSNVASATKLADDTAYTAWGQKFFQNGKPQNVSGNLYIGIQDAEDTTQRYLYFWKGDGTVAHRGLMGVDETGAFWNYYNSVTSEYRKLKIGPNGLQYYNSSRGDSAFTIDSSGNVGIGTTSPQYKLDVSGTGNFGGGINTAGQVYATSGFMSGVNGGFGFHSEPAWYGLKSIDIGANKGLQIAGFGGIAIRVFQGLSIYPTLHGVNDLGTASNCWKSVFASKSVKIGDATLSWDSTNNALKVDKDFYSDGEVSAGGVAEEGTGGGTIVGGSGLERVTFTIPSGSTTFDCAHNLDTREITVAIYEEGNDYQQVLADVYLDDVNTARIVFGSATDVVHKVVIIG